MTDVYETNYENIAGVIEWKRDNDEVIYETDKFYICKRGERTLYFCKHYSEHDGDVLKGIFRLNDHIVQCGFLHLIDELLEKAWMYDQLDK